jgi:hypothetical protein
MVDSREDLLLPQCVFDVVLGDARLVEDLDRVELELSTCRARTTLAYAPVPNRETIEKSSIVMRLLSTSSVSRAWDSERKTTLPPAMSAIDCPSMAASPFSRQSRSERPPTPIASTLVTTRVMALMTSAVNR